MTIIFITTFILSMLLFISSPNMTENAIKATDYPVTPSEENKNISEYNELNELD